MVTYAQKVDAHPNSSPDLMRTLLGAVYTKVAQAPRPGAAPMLRYGAAGLLSAGIYWLLVALQVELLGLDPVVSTVTATAVIIITSYFINRQWVFNSERRHKSAFPRFLIATLMSISLNASIMHGIVHLAGWSYVYGLAVTTVVVPSVNFAMNYWWCFRPDSDAG